MRRLTITETDYGQWIIETSTGVRSHGATLESALTKLGRFTNEDALEGAVETLDAVFAKIAPINTGQIQSGQAGA